MTKAAIDSLIYIDDYIDVVEALQLDLQRNFTLLKEMDGYAQESTSTTAKAAIDLIDNVENLDANDRFTRLKSLVKLLEESAQRSSEKATLAKVTSDAVDRHCNRLDADLVKFEEYQPIGALRIASLPGLTPSSKSLREYSKSSTKDKLTKRVGDRRDSHLLKKRKIGKEDLVMKESRHRSIPSDKNTNGKQIKTMPPSRKSKKSSDTDMLADQNEPLYCYCQQISYGEMVACDNTDCDIEWFHIACVDLKTVPKGKWYCDNCTKYKGKQRRA